MQVNILVCSTYIQWWRILHSSCNTHTYVPHNLSGGQRQAQRVSKLMAKCSRNADKLLQEYNHLQVDQQHHVTLKEVFSLDSPFWCSDHTYSSVDKVNHIPSTQQRRVIELYRLQSRCSEELQLCISDMLHLYSFTTATLSNIHKKLLCVVDGYISIEGYSEHDCHLYSCLSKHTSVLPRFQAGVAAVLINTAEYTFHRLHRIEDVTHQLSNSYWATDRTAVERYLQHAARLSRISVHSRIEYLLVSADDSELIPLTHSSSLEASSDTDTNSSSIVDSSSTDSSSDVDTDHD